MKRKALVILVGAFVLASCVAVFLIVSEWKSEERVACPMDARLCPDGTAVGRSGPDCSFAPCPGEGVEE